ncbi:MAG TPA: GNAT family N-acetyltransferase [Chloroflexota bacterium]
MSSPFEERRPFAFRRATKADHAAVLELLATAFRLPVPDRFAANQLLDPHFRYNQALLALLDGRPVSHLVVHRWRLRLLGGPAVGVPFGGIGEVATHPDVRGRGYSSELLRRSIGLMARFRQPLAALGTPIPDFYARLGWESIGRADYALSFPAFAVPPGDADTGGHPPEAEREDLAVRPFRPEDLDACVALYRRFCARRPRSLVRTRAYWEGQLEKTGLVTSAFDLPPSRALVAVARPGGSVTAYSRFRDLAPWGGAGLGVDEACYVDPAAMRALWPHLLGAARDAARDGRAALAARLPDDHELARLMLGAGGRRDVERGQMFRLNDLALLFRHLRRSIERRLRRTSSPALRLHVAAPYRWLPADPGGGAALLSWDGERLTIEAAAPERDSGAVRCPFDSTAWLRLLLGESTLAALLAEYECPDEVGHLLEAALPDDWLAPIYWRTDWF